jgi:hypothetical protein
VIVLSAEVLAVIKKNKILLAVTLLLLIAFTSWMKGCLDVDKCLDGGGRWNYEKGICEHQESRQEGQRK